MIAKPIARVEGYVVALFPTITEASEAIPTSATSSIMPDPRIKLAILVLMMPSSSKIGATVASATVAKAVATSADMIAG